LFENWLFENWLFDNRIGNRDEANGDEARRRDAHACDASRPRFASAAGSSLMQVKAGPPLAMICPRVAPMIDG